MESGLSHVADFNRDNFDAVEKLIKPEFIFTTLKERYGPELDTPQYYQYQDMPVARRIAHQFASIYKGIKNGLANEANSTPEDASLKLFRG
jgi:hypothetical protein